MTIRALLIDLDDTLYPERQYVESGFRAVADACGGGDNMTAYMCRCLDKNGRGRIFAGYQSGS